MRVYKLLSKNKRQTWPYQGWSYYLLVSLVFYLSLMLFILRVPPGSCWGWTPAPFSAPNSNVLVCLVGVSITWTVFTWSTFIHCLCFAPCARSLFFINHLRVNCRHCALWGILKNFKGLSKNQFILSSCQTETVRNALLIGAGERLTQRKGGRKARKLIDCSFSICLIWKSFIGCLWWLSLDFEVSTLRPVHT